jgi:uncharacterized protein YgiM (DUF1202 family)
MKLHIFLFIIISITLLSFCSAQEKAAITAEPNQALSFPYIAQALGDNVYVRSGPGTNYYVCGKLNKNDIVKVVATKYSWSCIVPPESCFSWISKQYITIDPTNPSVGIISGDSVRVRAGNEDGNPLHSEQVQGQVNKGEKVRLAGEEKNDYYKIYPPPFAYLWVSSQFVQPLGSAANIEIPSLTGPGIKVDANNPNSMFAPAAKTDVPKDLQQYYALEKLVKVELAKPLLEQDFSKVKQALQVLAGNKDAGKASRYAEYMAKRIDGFELAAKASKEVKEQAKNLEQINSNIKKAQESRLAELPNLGRFAVIGQFQQSSVYDQQAVLKHYKILDSAGQIICYALPASSAKLPDLKQFENKKIGLVGTIEPHPETVSALVRFSEIVELP